MTEKNENPQVALGLHEENRSPSFVEAVRQ